jgi:hypothetical protein
MIIATSIVLTAFFVAWCIGSVMDFIFNKINDKILTTIIIVLSTIAASPYSANSASAQNSSARNTPTQGTKQSISSEKETAKISAQKKTTEKPLKLKLSTSGVGDWSFGTLNFLVPDNESQEYIQTN